MKLSKTAWLVIGIGIFVIAFASLYVLNSRQVSEQELLNDNLSTVQAILPGLVSEKEALDSQLAQLESELAQATSLLDKARASFRKSVGSIEYSEILFGIADDSALEVISLTGSEPSDEKQSDVVYSVTSFTVEVKGKAGEATFDTEEQFRDYLYGIMGDILTSIEAIATGDGFTTATIRLVNISVPDLLTDAEIEDIKEVEGEFEKPSATIEFIIYSYKGE